MYKPESVFENETHKIPQDFKMQMDYSIPTRTNLVLTRKREPAL